MFEHLLVPLDGSRLAEAVLPTAAWLSRELNAAVTLIHIIEQDPPQAVHGDRHLTDENEARRYLDGVAQQYFAPGKVVVHVHTEKVQDVARSIADHSGELLPDLIVMCTHGEGGLRDIMAGSIAQQVIGRGKTPIFLVPPTSVAPPPQQIKKFLVALDGEQQHPGALPVAAELAKKLGAGLHLLTVVHTLGTLSGERAATGWMLPGATRAMLEIDEETARENLEKLALELPGQTNLTITTEVRRGNPAQQILAGATASKSDCIVLTTHGKSGMGAFWASSVGPKVVSAAHLPLLLIPAEK